MDRKIGPSVKLIAVFFIREIILARLGKFKNVPCKNSLLEELYCGENREGILLERGRIWLLGEGGFSILIANSNILTLKD